MRPARRFALVIGPSVFGSFGLIEIGLKLHARSLDLLVAAPFSEGLHSRGIRPMTGRHIWPSKMLNDLTGNSEPVSSLPVRFGS